MKKVILISVFIAVLVCALEQKRERKVKRQKAKETIFTVLASVKYT